MLIKQFLYNFLSLTIISDSLLHAFYAI